MGLGRRGTGGGGLKSRPPLHFGGSFATKVDQDLFLGFDHAVGLVLVLYAGCASTGH